MRQSAAQPAQPPQEMLIFRQARELIELTYIYTENFPRLERNTGRDKIRLTALGIYEQFIEINEICVNEVSPAVKAARLEQRLQRHNSCQAQLKLLDFYVEFGVRRQLISFKQQKVLTAQLLQVTKMHKAWLKSDLERRRQEEEIGLARGSAKGSTRGLARESLTTSSAKGSTR